MDEFTTKALVEGQYRTRVVLETMDLYEAPSKKAKVVGSIPQNALFLQTDARETISAERVTWMSVFYRDRVCFIPLAKSKPLGEIVVSGDACFAGKNDSPYRYDGDDFQKAKDIILCSGCVLLSDGFARINGKTYFKLVSDEKDPVWVLQN